ncbi:hypothetical protein EDM56_02940 [Brevibacillus fluminis]|uniref:Uncharacterized protein n=1 Tax=Brevibacillus fluminis TaxID=511487 RepID=A0A3M8DU72_9BACL|nr:hypothetical protein [Brevibacillus fluminis]RNB91728.1 hypothetical protein EDM56_02940 [Brevibacillus fluminis]
MLSANDKAKLRQSLQAEESKIVTIVLSDEDQVAGEIEHAGINGITLTDGRRYNYADIREINGFD